MFPISYTSSLGPEPLTEWLGDATRPSGWELYVGLLPNADVAAFEAVGVTWLVEGAWPTGDWVRDLRQRIADGPPSR